MSFGLGKKFTLFRPKTATVIELPRMLRLVLKFIYDRDHMSLDDIHRMEDSMVNWAKKLELDRDLGRLRDDEEGYVQQLAKLLLDDQMGKLDSRKKLFKDKGIDYRKFYQLPEAYCAEDFLRGQALMAENRKKEMAEGL